MYNLKVHQRNKHGNQLNKAPTTLSVGPDGGRAPTTYHAPGPEVGRAPTTVSVPPLRMGVPYAPHTSHYGYGVQAPTTQYGHHGSTSHQHVSNPHPYAHPYINNQVGPGAQSIPPTRLMAQHPHKYEYGEEVRAPTKVSVGPNGAKAPNTISVPTQKSQHGAGIDVDMDTDEESDNGDEDDEEEEDPDVFDILLDISRTFQYLQDLRKQYRDLLPQLKEFKREEVDSFLEVYSLVKTNIIEEQDGLEGAVFKTQHGKGLNDVESKGQTDEETSWNELSSTRLRQ